MRSRSASVYDLTATPPYGPWLDAFSCYQAIAETSLPSLLIATYQTEPQMWFELVRLCLAGLAVDQPLVVVLEDLHWSAPG